MTMPHETIEFQKDGLLIYEYNIEFRDRVFLISVNHKVFLKTYSSLSKLSIK